jgi:hypothetical protein
MAIAALLVPPLGIAVFGTAFAGWWVAVILTTIFFGLIGNNLGVRREKAKLVRRVSPNDKSQ